MWSDERHGQASAIRFDAELDDHPYCEDTRTPTAFPGYEDMKGEESGRVLHRQ